MIVKILKSKIHQAVITQANLNYIGSITIDEDLMEAASLLEGEKVSIYNVTNGERLSTYIIKGERGSGIIGLNGPSVRRMIAGDEIMIVSYAKVDINTANTFKPAIVFLKNGNKLS